MQIIYFRPHGSSGALNVEVNTMFAAHVWELLNKEFIMLSAKP